MRRGLSALILIITLVGLVVTAPPVESKESCIVNVSGTLGIVLCAGEPVANIPLPTVSIAGPTVTLPPLPRATTTKTVRPPQVTVTKTVIAPGPTKRVTVPGPTRLATTTKTVAPETVTRTEVREETKTKVVTKTVTQSPRQARDTRGTIGPQEQHPGFPLYHSSPAEAVGIGLLTLLALVGLILLSMYGGYLLGYKDSERENVDFMRALRDKLMVRGKHS